MLNHYFIMNSKFTIYFLKYLLLLIPPTNFIIAQEIYPQSYFISPIEIPLQLSGTFAELRSDHFHSGLDIRTGEKEGLKVFAVASGYVSRIKVSSGGYGKAIYISHPNGYVSVYGHLQQFAGVIGDYVKKEQYANESFEVDLYPEAGQIQVTKGEIIGLSGNSGSSGGPHLHFEIRDENSQKPVNPLLFGFKVEDKSPPVLNLLKVYPAGRQSQVEYANSSADFFLVNTGSYWSLSNRDTIQISGKVYFGIGTWDLFNNGNNKNGVYSIKLIADSLTVYQHQMESFSFDETRYINSLIDYSNWSRKKRLIQKSYIQPNNHLSIYQGVVNNGIISFNDEKVHTMIYEVADIAGNISTLKFYVKSEREDNAQRSNEIQNGDTNQIFTYKKDNEFHTDNVIFKVPGSALYDTMTFTYEELPGDGKMFSAIHRLHSEDFPLHSWCELSILAESVSSGLKQKALIVKLDNDKNFISVGGNWKEGYIHAQIREFGEYCVVADTVPPVIKPLNINNNKIITGQDTLSVTMADMLSGINSYRGTLNGHWILMEYDAKNDLLFYKFDQHLKKGENNFELIVSDGKNNISKYKANLIY